MIERKTYRVAGHVFSIEAEGYPALWKRAEENYGPFEVPVSAEGTLFDISVCSHVDKEDAVLIYTNKDHVESGFIVISVFRSDQGHYFEFTQPCSEHVNGAMFIDNSLKSAKLALEGSEFLQWLTFNTAVNFCYMLAASCLDTVLTHASCIIYEGKAYLFLGKSGTGKSTHSRMWLNAIEGTELMNDDHPVVRIGKDGKAMAYGSPWSGKTPCYKNMQAPVGGVIRIVRAPHNKARRLSPIESYASLMTSCSGMTWESDLADGRDRTIQSIIASAPCWAMECLPEENAAIVCCKSVSMP